MFVVHRFFVSLFLIVFFTQAYALSIVRMEMQLGADITNVDVELYDNVAPLNVANFLGYVQNGDYDNSFFHRKVDDFILQGGFLSYVPVVDVDARFVNFLSGTCLLDFPDPITGELGLRPFGEEYYVDSDGDDKPDFLSPLADNTPEATADPCDGLNFNAPFLHPTFANWEKRFNTGMQPVNELPPVVNEFNISNTRGTLAMALLGNQPDSASNSWFVNLSDNSVNLDSQNGGFTVFGKVLGSGMDFFDFVNNNVGINPIAGDVINPALSELPVFDLEAFTLMHDKNLVKVKSAREILYINTTDVDFGFVDVNTTSQITLTLSNRQVTDLIVSKVGDVELIGIPYSVSDSCLSSPVAPASSCDITITFSPTIGGTFTDILDVSFGISGFPNISINVSGVGVDTPPRLVSSSENIDFQFVVVNGTGTESVILTNHGTATLTFGQIISDSALFSQSNNCTALNFNESCTMDLIFSPLIAGIPNGIITIASDDPASPLTLAVTGRGSDTVESELTTSAFVDFGDTVSGSDVTKTLTLSNTGNADLIFDLVACCGAGVLDYEVTFTACGATLAFGSSCTLKITFSPQSTGEKFGTITFSTNDPVQPELIVTLAGTSSADNDNVNDAIEDSATNGGDGDNDGVADSQQGNVASIRTSDGSYITLSMPQGPEFQNVILIDSPSSLDEPAGVVFTGNYMSYEISGAPLASTDLGIRDIIVIQSRNAVVNSYYHYGPTSDDPDPHWYEFLYDIVSDTGAQILNDVEIEAVDGSKIIRDMLVIRYKDGGRGDDDLTANGSITSVAVVSGAKASTDSGSMSVLGLFVFYVLLNWLRRLKSGGCSISSVLRDYR